MVTNSWPDCRGISSLWPTKHPGAAVAMCHAMSSRPVSLRTHLVGGRCTLNLPIAQMSSRWCGVVVRRGGTSSGVILVT
ncbi:hypothetical protein TNCV_4140281 [Trichonephila clavipes]|nr:hypothetical protein TNCV_4140281 [Trichonephila clavipes]